MSGCLVYHRKNFTLLEREKIGYMPQHFVLYPDLTSARTSILLPRFMVSGTAAAKRLKSCWNSSS